MKLTIDTSDARRLERYLKLMNRRGLPHAIRNTLNDAAFDTMRRSKKHLREDFILRNKFTERSIHVRRATGTDISRMRSRVGSSEEYMADQEFGGVRKRDKGRTISIPTTSASGQGMNNVPRKKTVRKPNRLDAIKLKARKYRSKTKGMSPKQAAVVQMAMAAREGDQFVFLNLPWGARARGIFKLMGGKRKPKIRLIHEMSKKRIPIKRRQWLKPSVDQTVKRMPRIYVRRIAQQLRFIGVR